MTIDRPARAVLVPELVEASDEPARRGRGRAGAAPARPRPAEPLASAPRRAAPRRAYCLLPVLWVVIASTKSAGELFSTFTFAPSTHLWDNIAELTPTATGCTGGGWLNTALYAGVGAHRCRRYVSAMAGYALAKYEFPGKRRRLQRPARRACSCRASSWRSRSTCCSRRSG